MYYQEWEAMHLIQIGCLEPADHDSQEYWEPIPQEILEEAYRKEKLYKQEQQRLKELQRRRIEDNIRLFLETPGLYAYDPMGKISSTQLYEIYSNWCLQEEIPIQPLRAFCLYVKKHASHYRLVYAGHIPDGNGKRVRGFQGIRQLLPEEFPQT